MAAAIETIGPFLRPLFTIFSLEFAEFFPMMTPRTRSTDCFVTGATGLVGNNIVRLLASQGRMSSVLVRPKSPAFNKAFEGLSVERFEGSLDDQKVIDEACEGASLVIHAAATVAVGRCGLETMRHVNVEGTRRIARAARHAGARMIHISSVDALGLRHDGHLSDEETPKEGLLECPYVVTKREAEQVVLEEIDRGLDAVIVNPVFMLGPWDWKPSSGRMLLEVGSGWGVFAPSGSNDFADVRDVAEGILAAAHRGITGRRYILGGHPRTYLEAWRCFARVAEKMQPLGCAHPQITRVFGRIGDLVGMVVGHEMPINSVATEMSMLAHNFSSNRAVTELGYHCRSFETTVIDTWHWFLEHGYARSAKNRPVLAR